MPMSKLAAWTIFKSAIKGQEEGLNAIAALVGDEAIEYQAHVEQINLELAEVSISAQNEGAALFEDNLVVQILKATPAHLWVAQDYRDLVTVFEGSKYERLHLTAFFRIENTSLLLDAVKPAA